MGEVSILKSCIAITLFRFLSKFKLNLLLAYLYCVVFLFLFDDFNYATLELTSFFYRKIIVLFLFQFICDFQKLENYL